MNFLFKNLTLSNTDRLEKRLFQLAGLFLLLYSAILTLAPAVRLHSLEVSYRWKHWLGFVVWLAAWYLVHRVSIKYLQNRDPFILPITSLMTGWGLLSIWRLDEYFGTRQTIWLLVSLLVVFFGFRSHHLLSSLRRYKYIWLTTGLLLMALTFIIGLYPSGEGPRLWLGCCGIYLQPSEPLKLLLIIYLAGYLSERVPLQFTLLPLIIPSLVLTGAALVILLAQRDLGTASIFLLLYSAMIFLASGHRRIILVSLFALTLAGFAGYQLFNVIQIRVDAWLNPWLDAAGGSYQIIQSLQALAAGGVFGSGPGLGSPGLVPVAHSDFIFSAIAEETGLFGAFGVLLILALLTSRAFIIATKSPDLFTRFLAAGLSVSIAMQSVLIIGGNIRLLPLTGVTLPFFSYGGSSLLTSLISVMILTIISNQTSQTPSEVTLNRSFQTISVSLFILLLLGGSFTLWWSIFRGDFLLNRSDNQRTVITDRYVKRGSLLDRNGQSINQTTGTPGSFVREYNIPALGNLVGYTHPVFGLSGLELAMDGYLRGLDGTPASTIWFTRILSSQTPPGNNVRLTIDSSIQAQADLLLDNSTGTILLMNAATGEVLAAASHPGIDPSQLDQLSQTWKSDPASPYLNRVLQGSYPLGTAAAPFLLARLAQISDLPPLPSPLSTYQNGELWDCLQDPGKIDNLGSAIMAGCPAPTIQIAETLTIDQISLLYHQLGFYSIPSLSLPQINPSTPQTVTHQIDLLIGSGAPMISPLQMGMAVSALTNSGILPSPRFVLSVQTPDQGWVVLPEKSHSLVMDAEELVDVTRLLQLHNIPAWHTLAQSRQADKTFTWFIGGTLPDWRGAPLALVILLEEDAPDQALKIGTDLFNFVFQAY